MVTELGEWGGGGGKVLVTKLGKGEVEGEGFGSLSWGRGEVEV